MKIKNKKRICKTCRLFDPKNKICRVIVIHEGEKTYLPVSAKDKCFFEEEFVAVKEEIVDNQIVRAKDKFKLNGEIKQVRFWVEDEKGVPTDGKGSVKIEYDDGFFGKENEPD